MQSECRTKLMLMLSLSLAACGPAAASRDNDRESDDADNTTPTPANRPTPDAATPAPTPTPTPTPVVAVDMAPANPTPTPTPPRPDAATPTPSPDAGPAAPVARVTLPITVDDVFLPSGYMGDGETAGAIVDAPCVKRAAVDAKGVCHTFAWTPGAKGWAGVWWQYPLNNWGTMPGLAIAAGAKEVRFWAWGETGTEKVTFFTGYKMTDGFNAEMKDIALKTTPTAYTLSLSAAKYDRVAGGFGWVSGGATAAVKFSVDGIEWR